MYVLCTKSYLIVETPARVVLMLPKEKKKYLQKE